VLCDPEHSIYICGDFNLNALQESDSVKEMIISKHENNREYLLHSGDEYSKMI
jgi:hypothetical protein